MSPDHDIEAQVQRLLAVAVMMIADCEHMLDILEGRAEEQWSYEHQRARIAQAKATLLEPKEEQPCP